VRRKGRRHNLDNHPDRRNSCGKPETSRDLSGKLDVPSPRGDCDESKRDRRENCDDGLCHKPVANRQAGHDGNADNQQAEGYGQAVARFFKTMSFENTLPMGSRSATVS
jgi:hypothetical protein